MKKTNITNTFKLILFTIMLGAFAGIIVWCFLKAVSAGTLLLWKVIPARTHTRLWSIPICAAGGALAGLLHKRFGDYPEDLQVVMSKVKQDKHYSYHPMLVMLLCALLPLLLGASVGPEAGLTGIIAALCYWVGDNVTLAKENAGWFSELGEAVTLGQLFHSPLFGILAVEEEYYIPGDSKGEGTVSKEAKALTRPMKFAFYGLSTASGFLAARALTEWFGKALEGFPGFSSVSISTRDYLLMLLYIPAGLLLCKIFDAGERLSEQAACHVPVIAREIICGILIALIGLCLPLILFSGEEQMAELMKDYGSYGPVFLIGAGILKLLLTAFCIRFGLKGGHFFPVIFSCVCVGYGIAMLVFAQPTNHLAFAAAVVTASALGGQLKKPLAVSILMLICFPARVLLWVFLAAAISGQTDLAMTKHFTSS